MSARGQTTVTVTEYHGLDELPDEHHQRPDTGTKCRKLLALLVVGAFVAASVYYLQHDPTGKEHVSAQAKQAREQLAVQLKKLQPYVATVLLAAGLALTLAGRRLYSLAIFTAGSLMGGFVAYTLFTTLAAEWTGGFWTAQHKMWMTLALTLVGGGVLGRALASLERVGTAAVAGAAGWAAGALLYPLTLDRLTHVWWGQYAVCGVCCALAALVVYGFEDHLLVYTTAAFGAFASTAGGAKLFFHYSPTSADFKSHWGDWKADGRQILATGDDKDFYYFVGAVLGMFVLGLLVQLKLDPYLAGKRGQDKHGALTFYPEDEEAAITVQAQQQGVRGDALVTTSRSTQSAVVYA